MQVEYESPGILLVTRHRGENGTIYTSYASVEVDTRSELYRPLWDILSRGCHSPGAEILRGPDETMLGGEGVVRAYKVFDKCPSGVPHKCRERT